MADETKGFTLAPRANWKGFLKIAEVTCPVALYPMARKVLEGAELVDEAEVEHAAAKQLIAEIESMSPRDKLFDAKVKVLGEYVKHHVREEENELFPKMRERDLEFYKLGQRLAARKMALLIERRS